MTKETREAERLGNGFQIYRRLLHYGLPYWRAFALSVLGMGIYALLGPAFAKLIQPLIDGTFIDKDPAMMRQAPLVLLGLSLARGISGFAGDYYSGYVSRRIITDLRRDLFDQLLYLPCRYYDQSSSGQLLSRLLYNTEQVSNGLTMGIVTAFKDSLTIIGLLALMIYENVLLSMIFMVVGPVLALSIRIVSKRFRRISMRIQESMGNVSHVAQEVIDAHRIVKVFNGDDYERAKFARENESNMRRHLKLIATDSLSSAVIQFIYIGGFAAILYVVSLESVRNTITPGSLITFIAAMAMMLSPIKRLIGVMSTIQKGIAAGDSIFEMLDSEREHDTGTLALPRVRGHIEYRAVGLSYHPDQPRALNDIDLRIEAGKTIALVGQSGSGKTSLVRLLPRLYEPSSGKITIDGHDIRELRLDNLREHIAYVGQEVTLFNDTVASNIAYGRRGEVSAEEIRAVAEAAHALDFIEALPQGFETMVGQHGIVLSGGQRQRIAIARALLKDAPILILDEATSALDAESERHVQAALEVLMKNRTTLVIAHRLSTIQNADEIFVFRDGVVVERGSHQALLEAHGAYFDLHSLQFGHHAFARNAHQKPVH
jgi:ATP-binding cassette, subfamily B, bacterial MsbA